MGPWGGALTCSLCRAVLRPAGALLAADGYLGRRTDGRHPRRLLGDGDVRSATPQEQDARQRALPDGGLQHHPGGALYLYDIRGELSVWLFESVHFVNGGTDVQFYVARHFTNHLISICVYLLIPNYTIKILQLTM